MTRVATNAVLNLVEVLRGNPQGGTYIAVCLCRSLITHVEPGIELPVVHLMRLLAQPACTKFFVIALTSQFVSNSDSHL